MENTTPMTLTEARAAAAALAPGHTFSMNERPMTVVTIEQSVIECCPSGHTDTTGAYERYSIEALASLMVAGRAQVRP